MGDRAFALSLYLGTMLPLLTALGHGNAEQLQARFARVYDRRESRIVCMGAMDIGWMQVSRAATALYIEQIHLVPDWRGRGIGSALIRRVLARAGLAGLQVDLDVIYGNPAVALYERLGFVVTESDHEKWRMVWRPGS